MVFHFFHHPFWWVFPHFWKHPYVLVNVKSSQAVKAALACQLVGQLRLEKGHGKMKVQKETAKKASKRILFWMQFGILYAILFGEMYEGVFYEKDILTRKITTTLNQNFIGNMMNMPWMTINHQHQRRSKFILGNIGLFFQRGPASNVSSSCLSCQGCWICLILKKDSNALPIFACSDIVVLPKCDFNGWLQVFYGTFHF